MRQACLTLSHCFDIDSAFHFVRRHLYAMLQLFRKTQAQEGKTDPTPAFFTDPGYAQLGHTVLSTSNCGNPALRLFGFGPVVPDGFGIGYIIKVGAQIVVLSASMRKRGADAGFTITHRMMPSLSVPRPSTCRPAASLTPSKHTCRKFSA